MPRPKGSKKDKNQANKILLTSSSRTSISSPLSYLQPSIILSNINYSNDFINDDMNWIKTSPNKGGRPRKTEYIDGNDDNIIPITSSSEINGNRVIVNPAVLRYLEQNRNINYSSILNKTNHETDEFFNKNISIDMNEKKDNLFKNFSIEESINNNNDTNMNLFISPKIFKSSSIISNDFNKNMQDDVFSDLSTYSTDFLTTARLAQWILNH